MKKSILLLLLSIVFTSNVVFAKTDKFSEDYLKNHKHFSIVNPIAENIVKQALKKSLKKETGVNFDVKFSAYTLSSMKKGIFKTLELTGENAVIEGISIPYIRISSLSDYNYIDYSKTPIEYKSDMEFKYEISLDEDCINSALNNEKYNKVIEEINQYAYPMFQVKSVSTKIQKNRIYILVEYNFPIVSLTKNRVFIASCDLNIVDGKIHSKNIELNSEYGKLSLNKVANLLNFVNPLQFTLSLIEKKDCNANIENVKIIDNKVQINGKIFVEGE